MIFILVYWKILPSEVKIQLFLQKWKQLMPVEDRSGLISEFISEVNSKDELDWITDDFRTCKEYTAFLTIGIWRDSHAFYKQLGRYFNEDGPKESFEFERRTRTVLSPRAWRRGGLNLPHSDSPGTK